MKVGDLVKFASDGNSISMVGVIIADSSWDPLHARAFDVLWNSGNLTERTSPAILEVINENR